MFESVKQSEKGKTMRKIKIHLTLFAIPALIVCAILLSPTSGYTAEPPKKDPGYLYAIRGGVLIHDINILGHSEESGADFNLEALFVSPDWLEWLWAPHPHLGIAIHSQDDTNQIYSGLTWEKVFSNNFFINLSLGLTLHDGIRKTSEHNEKELGSDLLFREALEFGYQIKQHQSLSIFFFHISNAGIYSENDGMNHLGLRYGYTF